MPGLRPDVSDEDIGIRSYQLQKERAVERAVEKIRQKMAENWKDLKSKDRDVLNWVLGEVWAFAGRQEWDDFSFSGLSLPKILQVISIGDQILNHEKRGYKGFEEIRGILKSS